MCSVSSFDFILPDGDDVEQHEHFIEFDDPQITCLGVELETGDFYGLSGACSITTTSEEGEVSFTSYMFSANEFLFSFAVDTQFFPLVTVLLPDGFSLSVPSVAQPICETGGKSDFVSLNCSETSDSFLFAPAEYNFDFGLLLSELTDLLPECQESSANDVEEIPLFAILAILAVVAVGTVIVLFSKSSRQNKKLKNERNELRFRILKDSLDQLEASKTRTIKIVEAPNTPVEDAVDTDSIEDYRSRVSPTESSHAKEIKSLAVFSKMTQAERYQFAKSENNMIRDLIETDIDGLVKEISVQLEGTLVNTTEEDKDILPEPDNLSSLFSLPTVPNISIENYLKRMITYIERGVEDQRPWETSIKALLLTMIYFKRFLKSGNYIPSTNNIHVYLATSMLVCLKFSEDEVIPNKWWAKVAGMDVSDLNAYENAFCFSANFDFHLVAGVLEKCASLYGFVLLPSHSYRKREAVEDSFL